MSVAAARIGRLLLFWFTATTYATSVWDEDIVWHSQIGQDKYVMQQVYGDTVPSTRGYFVEIGAANGVFLSNALTLEETFGWDGLCVEPSRQYAQLVNSGRTCAKRNEPLANVSGKVVDFFEDVEGGEENVEVAPNRDLTMMVEPSSHNLYSGIREHLLYATRGEVTRRVTRTLVDLLDEHRAPHFIHFLSLDTEGSEYIILQHFNFSKYIFGAVAVEHNHQEEKRERIHSLLGEHGYVRTRCIDMDDLYVHVSLLLAKGVMVDSRECNTTWASLPCPQRQTNIPACMAFPGMSEKACGRIEASMLTPTHECSSLPNHHILVKLGSNSNFSFQVSLSSTKRFMLSLGPSSNITTLTMEFCTEHDLPSDQCMQLGDRLEDFLRINLQMYTRDSLLEVIKRMEAKNACFHGTAASDRLSPGNNDQVYSCHALRKYVTGELTKDWPEIDENGVLKWMWHNITHGIK